MEKSSFICINDFINKVNSLSYFPKQANIAVAVSGGADSLCLAILLKEYCILNNYSLTALIVDHKLREESTKEANYVVSILKKQDINSVILTREEIPLFTKTQEIARQDRYNLLSNYCKKNYISHLFIAHHFNDQIETIVMREEKGQNLIGGAGISAKVVLKDVILLRPFLNYTKQQIINTLLKYTKEWVEDPSNNNNKYHRVRVRNFLKENELPLDYLQKIISNTNDRIKIENFMLYFLSKFILINKLGILKINRKEFLKLSKFDQINLLARILKFMSEKNYAPKQRALSILIDDIVIKKSKRRNLAHCILSVTKEHIIVIPEYINYKDKFKTAPLYPEFKEIMHNNNIVMDNAKYFYGFTYEQLYNYIAVKKESLFTNLFAKVQK